MDRATYDRMAEIDQDHWWFVARRRIIAALIERHRPKPGPMRILEVGAGTGSNLDLLKRYETVDAIERLAGLFPANMTKMTVVAVALRRVFS